MSQRAVFIICILFYVVTGLVSTSFAETVDWQQVLIIDVRSRGEWNDGHLEGSLWIPWAQIEQGVKRHNLQPEQTLAFYCERGVRANRAIRRLQRLGFNNTINLISLTQASHTTGRPIVK